MRVALAQINTTVGDLQGNLIRVLRDIDQAKAKGVDIIVFPELTLTGYPPEDLLHKEQFVEDNLKILNDLVSKIQEIIVIVGFVDRDKNGNLYNAAAVIHNLKIEGMLHKTELPNYGVFDEKRYFCPGQLSQSIFSLDGVLFGVNICEDIWVDGGIVDEQIKQGSQIIFNLSGSPFDVGKFQTREKLLKRKAKEHKVFVCYVNLVGGQDELVFDGGSFIVNPDGNIEFLGKEFEENLIIADLNLEDVHSNEMEDSVIRLSSNIKIDEKQNVLPTKHMCKKSDQSTRVYKALVLGTRDYVLKNRFKKVLIGLSGGIDSALVAAIAVDALGIENVVGVSMPSQYNSEGTKSDARILAKNLKIEFKEIAIENICQSFEKTLTTEFNGLESGLAEENIQARVRGNLLMAMSNKFGWMVLTTGNKSEVAVGYCTLYGDMSGGFAVISDVPKTMVYELCRLVNQKNEIIPNTILTRPPSAELRANQKDEDSLPSYNVLDDILKRYVELHQPVQSIINDFSADVVYKIIQLVDRSEYKRRQSAPGIKISQRSFGRDWRLPITNRYKEIA